MPSPKQIRLQEYFLTALSVYLIAAAVVPEIDSSSMPLIESTSSAAEITTKSSSSPFYRQFRNYIDRVDWLVGLDPQDKDDNLSKQP